MLAVCRSDHRPDGVEVRTRSHQFRLQPVPSAAHIITQQRRWLVDVHDQDIDVPIVIEVAEGHATAGMRFSDRRASIVQKFLEFTSAQVAEQYPGRLVGKLRMLLFYLGKGASGHPEDV